MGVGVCVWVGGWVGVVCVEGWREVHNYVESMGVYVNTWGIGKCVSEVGTCRNAALL